MSEKSLKSIWVFHEGKFVGRRWVVFQQDGISAPPLAAISVTENQESVNAGLSEELALKKA